MDLQGLGVTLILDFGLAILDRESQNLQGFRRLNP